MSVIVLIDTSAFVALVNPRDRNHQAAAVFQGMAQEKGFILVTSNFVLDETYTWLARRINHATAVAFGRLMRTPGNSVRISRISEPLEERAWAIFAGYADKQFSYTDCTSFALMEQLEARQAFSFDHDFRRFGFMTLPVVEGIGS